MSETADNEHRPADASEQFDAEELDAQEQFGAEEQLASREGGSHGPSNGSYGANGVQDADLRRVAEVPLELSVEIGRTQMTVGETLDLRAGSIVTLDRLAGEPVDLLVNGTPIARGEVVVVDEQFGLRVTEILEGDPDPQATSGQSDPIDTTGEAAPAGAEVSEVQA